MNVRTFCAAAAVLLLAPATRLHGQTLGVSAGLVAPLGTLGEHRDVGFRVQGSFYIPGGRVRADVAGVMIPGEGGNDIWYQGDWRTVSAGLNVLPRIAHTETVSVRALAGLSVHRVSVRSVRSPYGTVPGAQLGTVVERAVVGGWVTAELGIHLVATDLGVEELEPVLFAPLTVGFRW